VKRSILGLLLVAGLLAFAATPARVQTTAVNPPPPQCPAGNTAQPNVSWSCANTSAVLAWFQQYLFTIGLGQSFPVTPAGPTTIPQALTAAANKGGGTINVQYGTYNIIGSSLLMPSNTKLVCEPGTILHTVSTGWSGNHAAIQNINNTASQLTDHDIEVNGCTYTEDATFAADGTFHAVQMIMASRIRVDGNIFNAGGDGTAMIGTADTVVARNSMTGALNACWDHWNAPVNLRVTNNYCQSKMYGVLVTGTGTVASAGVALGGAIIGNQIALISSGAQAGIWIQGIGLSGSGAVGEVVSGNYIYGDGIANFTCGKVSGASFDNIFINNTCRVTNTNSQGFASAADSGGTPTNTTVSNNIFDNIQVHSGNIGVIALGGTGDQAQGNRISGGNYPSAFYLYGTNDKAINNQVDAGTGAVCNLTGATNPSCSTTGGGLALISAQTASSSASLNFFPLPTGYNTFLLDCNNILNATNNTSVVLRVGEGSTPTYETSGYKYSGTAYSTTGGATNPFSASAANINLATLGVSSGHGLNAKAWITYPGTGDYLQASIAVSYMNANDAPDMTSMNLAAAYTGDTDAITALQVLAGTGNITSGQCSLYGLSPS